MEPNTNCQRHSRAAPCRLCSRLVGTGVARALLNVTLVSQPDEFQLSLEPLFQRSWQHGGPVLVPLAAANEDLPAIEVEIANPQLAAFRYSHPCAVQEFDDEPMRTLLGHRCDQSSDFVLGKHGRKPLRPPGPDRIK